MPGGVAVFAFGTMGARRWNVLREDLPLPLDVASKTFLAGWRPVE
jgi:hypothetical protein